VLERGDIQLKTRGELQAMRASGLVLAGAIAAGRAAVAPGVSTGEIDEIVASVIADAGAFSNFLHYGGAPDGSGAFPATICASVNDEIVHGIPSLNRVLQPGDLLSIDAGCILDGWHSDSAISVHVGGPGPDAAAEVDLIAATEDAMWAGIATARAGGRLGDISWAIEASTKRSASTNGRRYSLVAGYGGHGIGTAMHMAPFVANEGRRGKGVRLVPGMALAIEPMLTLGRPASRELADGWTIVTRDGARAAHFEHSIAITSDGISVLTAMDGGAARLEPYGITPVDLG
jgi:methionyl aminopeptidase